MGWKLHKCPKCGHEFTESCEDTRTGKPICTKCGEEIKEEEHICPDFEER